MSEQIETKEPVVQNYALMGPDAVVIKIFENPSQDFVAEYNATHIPRIYACPTETQVGWVRNNGIFSST